MSEPMMSDPINPQKTPDPVEGAETASGGTPDEVQELLDDETTDDDGKPLENPSGG